MSATYTEPRIDDASLQLALQAVEPAALLVEPRILRRVIKQDRRVAGFGLQVPHHQCYTIQRDRLLVIVERQELNLSPAAELPKKVILLARPSEGEFLETAPGGEVLHAYWRLLFHARVHMALETLASGGELDAAGAFERRRLIGVTEFEEVRHVLHKDDLLLPPADDLETYIEFAATYLELRHFAPHELSAYFPAIRDWNAVDALVSRDVPHERIYRATRLPGAPIQSRGVQALAETAEEASAADSLPKNLLQPSPPRFWRLVARAERAGLLGNGVKAAILRTRARRLALPENVRDMQLAAEAELQRVVRRMQSALQLSEECTEEWVTALIPLLESASKDRWSAEARLLYDLQRVCIEHERGVYRVDLFGWLLSGLSRPFLLLLALFSTRCKNFCVENRSLLVRPLRRPLPLLRQVMITKHLRAAAGRISTLRVRTEARHRLTQLLAEAFDHNEAQMRADLRPRIAAVLDEVGLVPDNIPLRVARLKIIEELLDRIVERGFIHMGDLRDTLSQNNLKLADVESLWEALLKGDQLLRADKKLSRSLERVYRRGPIYLRWPQSLSSLAFGTSVGRFLTQYIILPYGIAFVAIEGLRYLGLEIAHFTGALHHEESTEPASLHELAPNVEWTLYAAEFVLGTLMLLLIHRPKFRRWMFQMLGQLFKFFHLVVVQWPTTIANSPTVQRILQSQAYAVIRNYFLRPAIFSGMLFIPIFMSRRQWDLDLALQIFLAMNLFLNSPLGRYADERVTDVLMRAWHELRIRVLAAAYQWVMDVFHQFLEGVERLLYAVDEWLRFRRGDSKLFLVVKGLVGSAWSVVRYLIRIYVTLLIEPQVNPIKHFPVVTVSHKLILPASIVLAKTMTDYLEPFMGKVLANTFVWVNVVLLPGVFGFLVWELKENWRLFAANRPRTLVPNHLGHHGETMLGLLRPGFHSGTLPKLYARLRRAGRKANETGDWKPVNQRRAALHHVEERLCRFFEREHCALLEQDGTLGKPYVQVGAIHLATNRVDVELKRADMPSAWLAIEEHQGWLLAYVRQMGWIEHLTAEQRLVWEAALAGLDKLLAVDVVREHVDHGLSGHAAWYEVVGDGIVAYPDGGPQTRVLYRLRKGRSRVAPLDANGHLYDGWPILALDYLVFRQKPILWSDWVEFWSSPRDLRAANFLQEIPPLLPGPSEIMRAG